MGTKNHPGKFDCYANALPDEPMFILLARDPAAPFLVRAWAERRQADMQAGTRPAGDLAMVGEAEECATAMAEWRKRNDGKWRKPPK